jgi:hypothetical protein
MSPHQPPRRQGDVKPRTPQPQPRHPPGMQAIDPALYRQIRQVVQELTRAQATARSV